MLCATRPLSTDSYKGATNKSQPQDECMCSTFTEQWISKTSDTTKDYALPHKW